MLERLGIITNCWRKVLDDGESFESLATAFCCEGFREIEIRDGEYLRRSSIARVIDGIEKTAFHYGPERWRGICECIHRSAGWRPLAEDADRALLEAAAGLVEQTRGAVYSYAMAFPWLSPSQDPAADERRIASALALACMLNPRSPRLRLVSLEAASAPDSKAAVSNLLRYLAEARKLGVLLTVENALHPAPVIHALAVSGGVPLTYDEANNYRPDGAELSSSAVFRRNLRVEHLASVHLKQKNGKGVPSRLTDGYVDIRELLAWLAGIGYTGDLLLEFAPADDPLTGATESRAYLRRILDGDLRAAP